MQPAMRPSRSAGGTSLRWIGLLASLGFFLLVGLLLFSRAVAQPFSHDEHQFVAAGWWVAYGGLIPYRDFPYHHMPYQIPLDALAVRLSPYLLLSARLVSWAAAWLACGILFLMVRRELRARGPWVASGVAGAAVVAFVSNPIVAYTTGHAWNHDWASALALLALMLQVRAIDRQAGVRSAFAVGLTAGLAAGVEGAGHLGAAEGTVGQDAAVLAGEGHALRDARDDDVRRQLRAPPPARLAGPGRGPSRPAVPVSV